MKNKKSLISVLLAAVLLCACAAGMLIFGAQAAQEGVIEKSVDGVNFGTVTAALESAKKEITSETVRIEITVSVDTTEPGSDYLFIDNDLDRPIVIHGGGKTILAQVATEGGSLSSVNDITLENLQISRYFLMIPEPEQNFVNTVAD